MDKNKVYEEQIKPLMDQVLQIAQQNKIPFTSGFQVNADEDDIYTIKAVQNMNKENNSSDISPSLYLMTLAKKVSPEGTIHLLMMARNFTKE